MSSSSRRKASAERLQIGVDEGFDLLRRAARSHRLNLHELAARVVSERTTPGPLVVAITKSSRSRSRWMRELDGAHRAPVDELRRRPRAAVGPERRRALVTLVFFSVVFFSAPFSQHAASGRAVTSAAA